MHQDEQGPGAYIRRHDWRTLQKTDKYAKADHIHGDHKRI